METAELQLAPDCPSGTVVNLLRRAGMVMVPAFADAATIRALLLEHREIIERSYPKGLPPDKDWIGDPLEHASRGRYPALRRVFYTEWVRQICDGYLGDNCSFNEAIVCTHERRPLEPITAPHFDTIPTLKFFVYLLDTNERNGAFRYAPGTHVANADAARLWLARGGRLIDLPNVARADEVAQMAPFCGTAGTLLIFDSNGFHTGGVLQPGEERRVVRAQSYPTPRLELWPARFSRRWFRETRWNPLNLIRRRPEADRAATGGTFKVRRNPDT
jgi:hypothetical protein